VGTVPIYEFYCPDCHTIFSFFSGRVNTAKRPDCPRCGRPEMERRPSLFAVVGRAREEGEEAPDLDQSAMEKAVASLAQNEAALDGDDPRLAARAMREFYQASGLDLGPGVEEYIRRLESGQDPEEVDQELGHLLDDEDPFLPRPGPAKAAKNRPPARDETLYELE
jgi:putative FmdB family regulatory protein